MFEEFYTTNTVLAFQIVGRDIQTSAAEGNHENAVTAFSTLIDCVISLCKNGLCRAIMPLLLMESYFESTPIEECKKMWGVFASFQEEFSSPLFINKTHPTDTSLAILNIVNSLLHRTSKVKDSAFRGSLMM